MSESPRHERSAVREIWPGVTGPIVVGMIHLKPLPGAPRYAGDFAAVRDGALADAAALAEGGVHGLMVENFGDVPFYPAAAPPEVVAHMTAAVAEVRRAVGPALPVGVNVLRNDGVSALAVAQATGASFIRVNVLSGARVADQGLIQGIAHDLLRRRRALGAESVRIFADVDVKHSAPLAGRPLEDEVADTLHRGLADGVIVSGSGTGQKTDEQHVRRVKAAAAGAGAGVFVGSGVTAESVGRYLPHADGFIVGTAFKRDGDPANRVEVERVRELVSRLGG